MASLECQVLRLSNGGILVIPTRSPIPAGTVIDYRGTRAIVVNDVGGPYLTVNVGDDEPEQLWEWVFEGIACTIVSPPPAGARPVRSKMFDYVKMMNEAFGNPEGDPHAVDGMRLSRQCRNIGAEFIELMKEFGYHVELRVSGDKSDPNPDPNMLGIRDALCDIMVFTLGAYHFMGLEADDDMDAVLDGVMTRFCSTRKEIEDTCRMYNDLGVKYHVHGEPPTAYLKSSEDQGNEYPQGKFLKSASYRLAVFPPLPPKKRSAIEEMRIEREAHEAERTRRKQVRDAKILAYSNELLLADGEQELSKD
jgi:hypothetical protein